MRFQDRLFLEITFGLAILSLFNVGAVLSSSKSSTKTAKKIPPEQRNMLQQNIKNLFVKRKNEDKIERLLVEGDWDFLNEYLATQSFEVDVDTTSNFNGIDFTIGTVSCENFAIKDIITEGSGSSTLYNLIFLVKGISLDCVMSYEYDGGFWVGSGGGNIEVYVDSSTSIQTTLSFNSPNFDTDGPSGASLSCSADVQIADLDFNNFLLNLIAPLLIDSIEPEVEPMICEQIEAIEDLLAQAVMDVGSIFDDLNQPLPPELMNPLYPEEMLASVLQASKLDFIDFAPIIGTLDGQLESLFQFLMEQILGEDGMITVPLQLPIAEGIDLVQIKLVGFNNFTFNPFSLIGNYTIQTVYEQSFLGIEADLAVTLPDNTTEIVEVKAGINGLALKFSSLLVVEALTGIPWTDPSRAWSCLVDSIFAFEIAGLSITSASLSHLEVKGLDEYQGPTDLLNEVSEGIFFMYDDLLIRSLQFFFETEVRDTINGLVATLSETCTEKLVGNTIYIPGRTACTKAQLFEGGLLTADSSDPGCVSEVHSPGQIMSVFDYATKSAAYFKEGQLGWRGKIEFMDDFTSSARMRVRASSNSDTKMFLARVVLQSCTQSCSA